MKTNVPFIVGHVSIRSNSTLEDLGKILSDKIFGGLEFGGKDLNIHEEIPAIFINVPLLGMDIVLDGFSGFKKGQVFNLSISPSIRMPNVNLKKVEIDSYLVQLLKHELKGIPDLEIMMD